MNSRTLFVLSLIISLCFAQTQIHNAFEAINSSTHAGGAHYVACNGYKSCAGSLSILTATDDHIFCRGDGSCNRATINTFRTTCSGSSSCYKATLNMQPGEAPSFYAYTLSGAISGMYATIFGGEKTASCEGEQGCAYANIQGSDLHYGRGAYGLMGAVIDLTTTPSANASVHFKGYYSGFGATVKCSSGKTCNVLCQSMNACTNLILDCQDNSCDVTGPTDTTSQTAQDILIYDIYDIVQHYDTSCSAQDPTLNMDDGSERLSGSDLYNTIGGPTCCRGFSGCEGIGVSSTSIANGDIVCSGKHGCDDSTVTSSGDVFCLGSFSCVRATITVTVSLKTIYCAGMFGCADTIMNGASQIYCTAYWACVRANVKSNGVNLQLYLLGEESGFDMVVTCDTGDECTLHCYGNDGCSNTICYGNCIIGYSDSYSKTPVINPPVTSSNNPTEELDPSAPTRIPSINPTMMPSTNPSMFPTIFLSKDPSVAPSKYPSKMPSLYPSLSPSSIPSVPSISPTKQPTITPSKQPTMPPSVNPTGLPSINPAKMSNNPSVTPSKDPTTAPSLNPSATSIFPTNFPSKDPSVAPSNNPSVNPTTFMDLDTVQFMLSITLKDCSNSENCDITKDEINNIIIARVDDNVKLLYTEIVNNEIRISLVAKESVILDKDAITSALESEYGDVDVNIEEHDGDTDITDVDNKNNNYILYLLGIIAAAVILGIGAVSLYCFCKTAKSTQRQQANMVMEMNTEIEDEQQNDDNDDEEIMEEIQESNREELSVVESKTMDNDEEIMEETQESNSEELYVVNTKTADNDEATCTENGEKEDLNEISGIRRSEGAIKPIPSLMNDATTNDETAKGTSGTMANGGI